MYKFYYVKKYEIFGALPQTPVTFLACTRNLNVRKEDYLYSLAYARWSLIGDERDLRGSHS